MVASLTPNIFAASFLSWPWSMYLLDFAGATARRLVLGELVRADGDPDEARVTTAIGHRRDPDRIAPLFPELLIRLARRLHALATVDHLDLAGLRVSPHDNRLDDPERGAVRAVRLELDVRDQLLVDRQVHPLVVERRFLVGDEDERPPDRTCTRRVCLGAGLLTRSLLSCRLFGPWTSLSPPPRSCACASSAGAAPMSRPRTAPRTLRASCRRYLSTRRSCRPRARRRPRPPREPDYRATASRVHCTHISALLMAMRYLQATQHAACVT